MYIYILQAHTRTHTHDPLPWPGIAVHPYRPVTPHRPVAWFLSKTRWRRQEEKWPKRRGISSLLRALATKNGDTIQRWLIHGGSLWLIDGWNDFNGIKWVWLKMIKLLEWMALCWWDSPTPRFPIISCGQYLDWLLDIWSPTRLQTMMVITIPIPVPAECGFPIMVQKPV